MVLTYPAIQYPIKISSIIGVCTTNGLIPLKDAELMGGHRCTREVDYSLCLRAFPNDNLILMYYILSAWWLYLLGRQVHHIILPGEVLQILVMTNNIMNLGYTYANRRQK